MTDKAEWGPWIDHDGKGCPVPRGTWVISVQRDGTTEEHKALCINYVSPDHPSCWDWGGPFPQWDIIRYRIRKPRALLDLIEMVENLPAPQPVEVDA